MPLPELQGEQAHFVRKQALSGWQHVRAGADGPSHKAAPSAPRDMFSAMKTLLCSAALLTVATLADAQEQAPANVSAERTTTQTVVTETAPLPPAPDALVMADGSVLAIRGEQASRMTSEIKLKDGSIVTPGGTVKRPDGSSVQLVDGQGVSANGNIGPAPQGASGATVIIESDVAIKPQ